MRKVAITGVGTINPIAGNKEEFREALEKMRVGIDLITQFDTSDQKVKIAGEVKNFNPADYMDKKSARRYDRFLQLAIAASREALEDSGLLDSEDWKESAAVIIGSGIGGFKTLFNEFNKFNKNGPKTVSPFLIPMMIPDMASGIVSIHYNIKGPNLATVSACASSLHAVAISALMIRHGYIDIAITGGSEAVIDPMPIAAFANMRALSTRNDEPLKASRPFDKNRDGFVMAEGAGILILEAEELARKRGAKIYGYIEGFGMTGDAYHISATEPTGEGGARAIEAALKDAGVDVDDIDLINCHATSTPVGDRSEVLAIRKVFKDKSEKPYIQSTKALIGHALGAAGAIELIGLLLEFEGNFVHGMPNLEDPDEDFKGLKLLTETLDFKSKIALKNSFGFGGHNISIVVKKGGE